MPIFPWHFADFLEHDPPLIDADYIPENDNEHENETNFDVNLEYSNGKIGLVIESIGARANKLRLSPPRQISMLRHTVSAAPPPVTKNSTLNSLPLYRHWRNFSAPTLDIKTQLNTNALLTETEKAPEVNVLLQSLLKKSVSIRATPANTIAFFDKSETNTNEKINNKNELKHLCIEENIALRSKNRFGLYDAVKMSHLDNLETNFKQSKSNIL